MNISNLRELNKEEGTNNNNGKNYITQNPNLTTSSWTRLKDPRIVRVSRAFGGKDRHSKVCTIRGLRDRRVRLSVPTAIQLYDLQDRLGLNQPSKVVDWLLDVAKDEINELPPLQFGPDLQSMLNIASQSENLEGVIKTGNTNGLLNWEDYWNLDRSKEKDHNFVQSSNQSLSLPAAFNNLVPNNGSFLKLNPSNFGSYDSENTMGSQFVVYPPPQSLGHNSRDQFDPKQLNFEMMSSSSSNSHLYINQGMVRPFELSMNPNNNKPFHSEENEGD